MVAVVGHHEASVPVPEGAIAVAAELGEAVAVEIGIALVDLAVAVVVEAVLELLAAGEDLGVGVIAVADRLGEAVAVVVGELGVLVDDAIAVVIDAVRNAGAPG